jgi:hypothetical protein
LIRASSVFVKAGNDGWRNKRQFSSLGSPLMPLLPAQTSNGTSSLDLEGNGHIFCISSSLQKNVSYQLCL